MSNNSNGSGFDHFREYSGTRGRPSTADRTVGGLTDGSPKVLGGVQPRRFRSNRAGEGRFYLQSPFRNNLKARANGLNMRGRLCMAFAMKHVTLLAYRLLPERALRRADSHP